jgi:GT2 family glycosyltransferase
MVDPQLEWRQSRDPAPARITVVVMTRDRRDNVLATLSRLTAMPEHPPIVLVDNASSDGTAGAVRAAFPSVQVTALDRNQGSAARTLGVRAAATPYVAFADDDSWWEAGSLVHAADVFDRTPRLGLLAGRILVGPDRRLDPVCAAMAGSPLPRDADAPGPAILGFVACGAIVRRQAYLDVGGFSPVIFFFGEETLLAQDLLAAGWQLAYVDSVTAVHDPGSVSAGRSGRERLASRNALLSLWMRRPAGIALTRTAQLLAARRDGAGVAGLLDALRRSPAALRERRLLPAHVEAQMRLLEAQR